MQTFEQMKEKQKAIKTQIDFLKSEIAEKTEENKTFIQKVKEYKNIKKTIKTQILNNKILLMQLSLDILEAKQTKRNGGIPIIPQ